MEDKLVKILGAENVFKDEMLSKHCTFGIGGKAVFFVTPTTICCLIETVNLLVKENVRWKIVGNCSNLLFQDNGFDGVIVCTLKIKDFYIFDGGKVLVSAGSSLSSLVLNLAKEGLSGIEFLCGIPGTVGGALFMNAGAHGRTISNIVESVTYFNGERIITMETQELQYSYRSSIFKYNPSFVILSCVLQTSSRDKHHIFKEIENHKSTRKNNQPFGKSAGSVFKAVDGVPAWEYIDGCELKGNVCGGAEISQKHANFIINNGNATAKDVLSLIELIKNKVSEKYKKTLELEIEIVN